MHKRAQFYMENIQEKCPKMKTKNGKTQLNSEMVKSNPRGEREATGRCHQLKHQP